MNPYLVHMYIINAAVGSLLIRFDLKRWVQPSCACGFVLLCVCEALLNSLV